MLNIPANGLNLESSTKMVGLPAQAFAISLSDSAIEDMIKRVQNGEGIQLSLGENPAFLLRDRDIKISPEPLEYDLFRSTEDNPTAVTKLPQPAMSIFSASRHMKMKPTKAAPPKTTQPKATKTDKPASRTPVPKANSATPRLGAVPDKDAGLVEEDDALANLKNTYARAEAEKRQLAERRGKASAALGNNLLAGNGKGGRGKPGKANLLRPQPITTSRSQPNSPGFGALASPSILSTVNSAQDRAKQQRTPIIHELAVQELSFDQLVAKLGDIDEEDLSSLLKKVADFDDDLQKWALKKLYWKELDVFQYDYETDEDRQKAIDNAIKVYDRTRIGSTDPLWQKLLPEAERNKGVCLSKLQAKVAAIANDAAARRQRTATPGISGADSEKDDSVNSGANKGKGSGEAMSRSSSQSQTEKKKASVSKKPVPVAAKAAPKTVPKTAPKASATKLATNAKAAPAKPGKAPLSKEFVTSSDDEDEAPLSKAKGAATQVSTSATKPAARTVEKPKLPERKEPLAQKAKPAPASAARPITTKRRDEERDTTRAQAPARPTKAPAKRQREEDEENDSSTSSTAPLSKRLKPAAKTQPASAASPAVKQRASSEATQANRANGSALAKSKNTSPVKSSPLAVSPPTNASEIETDKHTTARDTDRGRVRDRENERDTIVSRAGSNRTTSSASSGTTSGSGGDSGSGRAATNGKKRGAEDQAPEGKNKRQRLSEVVLNKAHAFKKFYTRYEALHRELSTLHDPPSERINNLLEMRERLQEMKKEIYREVPVEV
ncbi:hypothetical protein B0T18DRAFT_426140 [Schizothecium vesticola]|uniref:E3 ubiquitin-protein ligase UBR1-like winged-helix domain-containing protein n=1 Tax=Schizothecium vesticola TaxID=314040 RepID=A0AA40F5M8_9PEZI|nr:hypothetical protein B0T18DRAFT_426140 [Schizothecium vesticola]